MVIALISTSPYIFTAYSMHRKIYEKNFTTATQALLMTLNGIAASSILAPGYHFYGEHVYSLIDGTDIKELEKFIINVSSCDGGTAVYPPTPMTLAQKIPVFILLAASTLPLGWTKSVALGQAMGTSYRLPWLLVYSVIDAGPHINHLSYGRAAIRVFSESTLCQKFLVIFLMFSHAAEDMIDLANTDTTLFDISEEFFSLWLTIGIFIEFFSAGIESVIHSQEAHDHHHSSISSNRVLHCAMIIIGQITAAVYNTLTILEENPRAYLNPLKIFLFCSSLLGYLFIACETIHHLEEEDRHHEAHDAGDDGHTSDPEIGSKEASPLGDSRGRENAWTNESSFNKPLLNS